MRDALKKFGFSDDEISIYLLLLSDGSLRVTKIARKLSLARTTVYRYVENLKLHGLVIESIDNGSKVYSPAEPELIPELLLEIVDEVRGALPAMKKLYRQAADKSAVTVFRGKDGLKAVVNDIIREKKPYTCFGDMKRYFEQASILREKWFEQVEKRNIKGRLIGTRKTDAAALRNEEARFLPRSMLADMATLTYGGKTALFIWANPLYVVLIDDKSVAAGNQRVFDQFWAQARN